MNSNPPQTHQLGNISYAVTISLTEAATGKMESLIVPREDACEICSGTGQSWRDDGTCAHCNNTGYVRYEKRFEVQIPAGIEGGSRMRIAGEGNLQASQPVRGDLYLVINVSPHELFERKGKDLHSFFRLTGDEMEAGSEVVVPTLLDGRKRLRIPPGTNLGAVFRLAGLGLCSMQDAERGDLFIRVGNEPVKNNVVSEQKASAVTPPPPSTPRTSAVKEFVRNHSMGVTFTAGLLLFAGIIYVGSRPGGRRTPPISNGANVSSSPVANPTATMSPLQSTGPIIQNDLEPPPPPLPKPAPLSFSLPNGTNITPPQGPRGDITMTIDNSAASDMALKVVSSSSQKTRRFVFVVSGKTAIIRNLPRDVYLLRWETGSDWDVNSRRFLYGRSLHRFDKTFDSRRTLWTVRFTPSLIGTLNDESIDESEFEDK